MNTLSILLVGIDRHAGIAGAFPGDATILEAASGHEAIYLFSKHNPDLVITECALPAMSGIEVATAIRSIAPDARIILASAEIDSASQRQAVDAGVMGFIEFDRLGDRANIFLQQTIENITKQRELQAGQTILGHILTGLPHAALLIDWGSLRILSSNRAAQGLGYSPGDVCTGFLFPDGWRETMVNSLMSGSEVCHGEVVGDHGTWKTTNVMTSGKTIFSMAENVTCVRNAQERIQQSEGLLAAIFDNSYDSIFLFDAHFKVTKANQRVREMFGYQGAEVLELTFNDLVPPTTDPEDQHNERLHAALKGLPQLYEWKALKADGENAFTVEIFLRGLTIDGAPMMLASIRDVTDRRRAEVDFISIQRELEEHLVERKAALTDVTERLRLELSKCEMLQDKMGAAHNSYQQVIATARNDVPTVQTFHLAYSDLSSRELQVIMRIAKGLTISTIAEEMRLSPKTISTYKGRAMKKLNIDSESELILYALRTGLIN